MTGGLPAWARSAATLRLLVQVGVLGLAGACHSTGPASEASSDSAAHGAHGARLGEGADSAVAAGSEAQSAAASGDLDDGEPLQLEVPVEGAFPLLVWAPKGTRPHAVIVSAHGAGCLAEQHCGYLWRLARGRAIVACLRGEPLFRARPEQGFYFRDHRALGKELQLAVHALKKQFGERLGASWTFVGYSQGATMGALALPDSPVAFDQIVFIEGGGEGMT